jgi:glycosyltransferase involved in cell wall biosynthesis
VFSPLPPQRNGLADYLLEYMPALSLDFDVCLVAESGSRDAVRKAVAQLPGLGGLSVIDELQFLARQPEPAAQVLYNLGNNGDCAYALDHVHRFPGAVIVHDISLFYLHQVAAQRADAPSLLALWLQAEGVALPEEFLGRDGNLVRTPGLVYQECLMLGRLAASARGLMVHTRYAEQRLRGATPGVGLGPGSGLPLARIPHFVLEPPVVAAAYSAEVLARWRVSPGDFLMVVPGFLSGNKLLYEVLACFQRLQAPCPQARLLFAGEERAEEYPLSRRVRQLWPAGDGPQVTGYLDAGELDVLLARADLSFVLRFPTYGESSGILPRAAMGGGRVLTVDIGAYPEFASPQVWPVAVGAGMVERLAAAALKAYAAWRSEGPGARQQRKDEEAARLQPHSPQRLYPALKAWLDDTWEAGP